MLHDGASFEELVRRLRYQNFHAMGLEGGTLTRGELLFITRAYMIHTARSMRGRASQAVVFHGRLSARSHSTHLGAYAAAVSHPDGCNAARAPA